MSSHTNEHNGIYILNFLRKPHKKTTTKKQTFSMSFVKKKNNNTYNFVEIGKNLY